MPYKGLEMPSSFKALRGLESLEKPYKGLTMPSSFKLSSFPEALALGLSSVLFLRHIPWHELQGGGQWGLLDPCMRNTVLGSDTLQSMVVVFGVGGM